MAYIQMTFAADTLKRWTEIDVILPVEGGGPADQKPERFPALYLLHGFSGSSKDWLTYSNIRRYAEKHNIAVVMPSGENAFYVDNEELGLYHGAFIQELVEFTRKVFPLSKERKDTFIGGLSMGGFGALRNGMFYSDIFSKVISLSGAFIIEDIVGAEEGSRIGPESYGYYRRVFGELDHVAETDRNPILCAEKAAERGNAPKVLMACGTEDFLLENNRHVREALEAMGIDTAYFEGPGAHEWTFWDQWIAKGMDWLASEEGEEIR